MIEAKFDKSLNGVNGEILLDIDMQINHGEFVSIFGKSGAGKTSILRILSGLDSPQNGRIVVNNEIWFCSKTRINLPPQKRKIGFVFQDYALFSHLNIYKNLCFGLKNKRDTKKVDDILEIMELKNLAKKYPNELSGGQKQRVALARALVYECKILLLDEPLSAIDYEMRSILQDEILRLHRHFGLTTMLVSHDISEIMKLSSRILHLQNGKIISDGASLFGTNKVSAKFSFSAKILNIRQNGLIFIVEILLNNSVATITLGSEANELKIGDEIMVSSKAFNPMIFKL